jgi:hypothetical protein
MLPFPKDFVQTIVLHSCSLRARVKISLALALNPLTRITRG